MKKKHLPVAEQDNVRLKLIDEISCLLVALDEAKAHLSRPYADLFSVTLLPLIFYQLFYHTGVGEYLSKYVIDSSYNDVEQNNLPIQQFLQQLKGQRRYVVEKLQESERKMIDTVKSLMSEASEIKNALRVKLIDDVSTWPFPTQFAALSTNNNNHLLFAFSSVIDQLIKLGSGLGLNSALYLTMRERLCQLINVMSVCIMNKDFVVKNTVGDFSSPFQDTSINLEMNYQSKYPPMNCLANDRQMTDYAHLFRQRYFEFTNPHEEHQTMGQVSGGFYTYHANFFAAIAAALLTKNLLINQLAKKYYPIDSYLKKPLSSGISEISFNKKNVSGLRELKNELLDAEKKLAPYARRNKNISFAFNLAFILIGLIMLLLGYHFHFKIFFAPLTTGLLLERSIRYYANWKDSSAIAENLNSLVSSLKFILGDAANKVVIEKTVRSKLSLTSVTLSFKNTDENLSAKILADTFKRTLRHFSIDLMPSHQRTLFSLFGATKFKNPAAMQLYFANAIDNVREIQLLKNQMKKMEFSVHPLTHDIVIDQSGMLRSTYTIFGLSKASAAKAEFQALGFQMFTDFASLTRNKAFTSQELLTLRKALDSCKSESVPAFEFEGPSDRGGKKSAKSITPIITEVSSPTPSRESDAEIKWPSGIKYPGKAVPLSNGRNEFSFWNLTEDDFGDHANSHARFKEKSTQKASAGTNAQGIKVRPTLGTDVRTGQQRLFPARVKLLGGQHGNEGVLVDIEKSPNGETLYIACGFAPNVHN